LFSISNYSNVRNAAKALLVLAPEKAAMSFPWCLAAAGDWQSPAERALSASRHFAAPIVQEFP
jgi:hypothetical protein